MDKKSVLVIGAGSIGTRHTRCFLRTGRVEVAIVEPRDDRRTAVAAEYRLAGAYASLDDAPLDRFDCCVICVPAHLHVPFALRCLDAGCHVLIEKPLCLDVAEAERMVQAAEASDRVVGVAYTYRSMPFLLSMKQMVDSGEVGPVRSAVAVLGQHFPLYRPDYREIYYRSHETGGGALQDAATHVINYLQWIMGLEHSVYCAAEHLVLEGVEVEDTVSLIMRYPGRAVATVSLNQFQWNNEVFIELAGEQGTVRFTAADQTLALYRGGDWHVKQYQTERDDYYVSQAHNFLDAVDGAAQVRCTVQEAAETVRTMVAARRSWESGCEVRVR